MFSNSSAKFLLKIKPLNRAPGRSQPLAGETITLKNQEKKSLPPPWHRPQGRRRISKAVFAACLSPSRAPGNIWEPAAVRLRPLLLTGCREKVSALLMKPFPAPAPREHKGQAVLGSHCSARATASVSSSPGFKFAPCPSEENQNKSGSGDGKSSVHVSSVPCQTRTVRLSRKRFRQESQSEVTELPPCSGNWDTHTGLCLPLPTLVPLMSDFSPFLSMPCQEESISSFPVSQRKSS